MVLEDFGWWPYSFSPLLFGGGWFGRARAEAGRVGTGPPLPLFRPRC